MIFTENSTIKNPQERDSSPKEERFDKVTMGTCEYCQSATKSKE